MHIHAIVPVKALTQAKSRLADLLTPDERGDLMLAMLRRVLHALLAFQSAAASISAVWVISADPRVMALASDLGARPLLDTAGDLNAALELGRAAAVRAGAEAMLVIMADVPLLTRADLEALTAALAGGAEVVIASDQAGSGTNALGLALPSTFPFRFGSDSWRQHIAVARARGQRVQIYTSPTLGLDVDTPENLIHYQHQLYGVGW